jgi:hypothetical protein
MADEPIAKAVNDPSPLTPAVGSMTTPDVSFTPFEEIGVSGLRAFSGYIQEEYLPELKGTKAVKVYRMMSEGDAICCSVLTAIELILRAVDWRVEPVDDSPQAEQAAEFLDGIFEDMAQPLEDIIAEALSFLRFGWSYFEIIYKRRVGPTEDDGSKRSKFTDGKIGIRKLAIRSQDSLLRWEIQDDGGVLGMWQLPPLGGQQIFLPIDKCLLFRTTSRKNSPEGVSILRSAYRAWYMLKTIEDIEAVGIERELAGLPVVTVPARYLASDASAPDKALLTAATQMARDLKFNQQAGVVIPSDTWQNPDGTYTQNRLVDIKLLSTGGARRIDTDVIVQRHQRNIARSALADFIMLGDQRGSYALSKNKSELFLRACEAYLNQIESVINRFLVPRIWALNNNDPKLMPHVKAGRVAPVDLAELGTYIQQLAAAGAPLFPNEDLETYLADVGGLPEPSPDVRQVPGMPGQQNGQDTANETPSNPAELSNEGFMDASGGPPRSK